MSQVRGVPLAQRLLTALLFIGWAVAAHLASAGHGPADLHALVALAPLLLAFAMLLWQARLRFWLSALLALLAVAALAWCWSWLRGHLTWLFYLQHLGTHLALALWFARSLARGREPVVSAMARIIMAAPLSPRKQRYTRSVTWVWTLFFLGNAALSTLLFALAPVTVWSVHANLLTGPLLALMFALEMLVRRRVLPPEERPSISQILRAYRAQRQP